MKILWLCNIVLPELCEIFSIRKPVFGGWLSGMWESLSEQKDLEMAICVPIVNPEKRRDGIYKDYRYYSFSAIWSFDEQALEQQEQFKKILNDFQPDLVHIWGTEYIHTYNMVKVCESRGMLNRVVVNIQGLLSVYAQHYCLGMEKQIEILGQNNSILAGQKAFEAGGVYEKEVLRKVQYAIGRTQWDEACCRQINRKITYLSCGEILRKTFYERNDKWCWQNCRKHSILISQASYPIKGFHLVLRELSELKKEFPDLCVIVAGNDMREDNSDYGGYLKQRIKEEDLEDTICFVGRLNEEEMYEQYLQANVFLSPSTIENSSNSVCEAQMVGVPVVSSYVGGIGTLIEHGISGYCYPLNESYMMRYYVSIFFNDFDFAAKISKNEQERAQRSNNKNEVIERMIQIYRDCANQA